LLALQDLYKGKVGVDAEEAHHVSDWLILLIEMFELPPI